MQGSLENPAGVLLGQGPRRARSGGPSRSLPRPCRDHLRAAPGELGERWRPHAPGKLGHRAHHCQRHLARAAPPGIQTKNARYLDQPVAYGGQVEFQQRRQRDQDGKAVLRVVEGGQRGGVPSPGRGQLAVRP